MGGKTLNPAALLRRGVLLLLVLFMAGCGDVEWFPDGGVEETPTTPDAFTFAAKTNVPLTHSVESDSITVAGLEAATAPIRITGSTGSNSKYSVNDGAATSDAGTVKNGDKVTVSHTSAGTLGTTTESTLTIGNRSGKFTSTTILVQTSNFSAPSISGAYRQAFTTIDSVDVLPHVIKIKDSAGSGNAQYAITTDNNPTAWTSSDSTVTALDGKQIYVRNLLTTITGGATTTLTIDGLDFVVNLSGK